jgi:hypothetical protein
MKKILISVIMSLCMSACGSNNPSVNEEMPNDTTSVSLPGKTEPVESEPATNPEGTQPSPEVDPGNKAGLNDTALENQAGTKNGKKIMEKMVYPQTKGKLNDTAMEAPPHQ